MGDGCFLKFGKFTEFVLRNGTNFCNTEFTKYFSQSSQNLRFLRRFAFRRFVLEDFSCDLFHRNKRFVEKFCGDFFELQRSERFIFFGASVVRIREIPRLEGAIDCFFGGASVNCFQSFEYY